MSHCIVLKLFNGTVNQISVTYLLYGRGTTYVQVILLDSAVVLPSTPTQGDPIFTDSKNLSPESVHWTLFSYIL